MSSLPSQNFPEPPEPLGSFKVISLSSVGRAQSHQALLRAPDKLADLRHSLNKSIPSSPKSESFTGSLESSHQLRLLWLSMDLLLRPTDSETLSVFICFPPSLHDKPERPEGTGGKGRGRGRQNLAHDFRLGPYVLVDPALRGTECHWIAATEKRTTCNPFS